MTKADLVKELHELSGLSKREASDVVELVLDTVKTGLCTTGQVKIASFGNFVVREVGARSVRNPRTGERMTIDERNVLTFRPSTALKERLNGGTVPTTD